MRRSLSLSGRIGLILVALVVAGALLSLVWTPYDPIAVAPQDRLAGSSWQHLLGTDRFGRDIASRVLAGSRITLLVGAVAVALSAGAGVPLGMWAALRGGWFERLLLRGADLLLAFPALLLAVLCGATFGASTLTATVAIGVAGIPGFLRVARSGTRQVMTQDYLRAARLARRSSWYTARVHVLPNISGVLIVQATVAFSLAVLAEAALSFLGLGTAPPAASWGRMLQDAQPFLASAPHVALWPGLAIALTVLGCNLLGDALRDMLDPRLLTRRAAQ